MSSSANILMVISTLFLTIQGCNQGGTVEHRQRPATGGAGADASAHEVGRNDLEFKTESECKKNSGQWDGECYIMCMPPNTFDKETSKCISKSVDPVTGHEAGRYDISFKTEATCKTNQGIWDKEEGECYVICLPPSTFDKTAQKCKAAAVDPVTGHEAGRFDLKYKTESECKKYSGIWDKPESECYIICLPPKKFDQAGQMCMK